MGEACREPHHFGEMELLFRVWQNFSVKGLVLHVLGFLETHTVSGIFSFFVFFFFKSLDDVKIILSSQVHINTDHRQDLAPGSCCKSLTCQKGICKALIDTSPSVIRSTPPCANVSVLLGNVCSRACYIQPYLYLILFSMPLPPIEKRVSGDVLAILHLLLPHPDISHLCLIAALSFNKDFVPRPDRPFINII